MRPSSIPARTATAILAAAIAAIGACRGVTATRDGGATGGVGGSTSTAGGSPAGAGGGFFFDAGQAGGSAPEAGCGGAGPGDAGTGCDGVTGAVSYTTDVAPIFAQRCNGELCHVTPTRASLVGVPASECCDGRLLVAPGDAAGSYLVDKLTGHALCSGGRMPLAEPALADADVATIVGWICAGAPAN
jgi:hypothetical protein